MSTESKADAFKLWLRRESRRLKAISSKEAADQVCERLLEIDRRLGVEIERSSGTEPREMIFTAFSDRDAFPIVHDLVEKLERSSDWKFIALKPGRGFSFSLTVAGEKIHAAQIKFRRRHEEECAFQLIVPGVHLTGDGAEEMAWLIVETGVGEELASRITSLEFAPQEFLDGTELPILELADYVKSNCPG